MAIYAVMSVSSLDPLALDIIGAALFGLGALAALLHLAWGIR